MSLVCAKIAKDSQPHSFPYIIFNVYPLLCIMHFLIFFYCPVPKGRAENQLHPLESGANN